MPSLFTRSNSATQQALLNAHSVTLVQLKHKTDSHHVYHVLLVSMSTDLDNQHVYLAQSEQHNH
jgi:hypothetical protein